MSVHPFIRQTRVMIGRSIGVACRSLPSDRRLRSNSRDSQNAQKPCAAHLCDDARMAHIYPVNMSSHFDSETEHDDTLVGFEDSSLREDLETALAKFRAIIRIESWPAWTVIRDLFLQEEDQEDDYETEKNTVDNRGVPRRKVLEIMYKRPTSPPVNSDVESAGSASRYKTSSPRSSATTLSSVKRNNVKHVQFVMSTGTVFDACSLQRSEPDKSHDERNTDSQFRSARPPLRFARSASGNFKSCFSCSEFTPSRSYREGEQEDRSIKPTCTKVRMTDRHIRRRKLIIVLHEAGLSGGDRRDSMAEKISV